MLTCIFIYLDTHKVLLVQMCHNVNLLYLMFKAYKGIQGLLRIVR